MGTLLQRFYPSTTNWDGTDPAGGDVRKCEIALPLIDVTSSCDFGSSGNKTITVDPFTSLRTTVGLDSGFGFAINIAGADGMDGTATAQRMIRAGTWLFQGRVTSNALALANVTVGVNVYRVAASPSTTRTLIFSTSVNAGLVPVAGTDWTITTASQNEIIFQAGETLQITYTINATGQVGGLIIIFATGDAALLGLDTLFDVASPGIRTNYPQSADLIGKGTVSKGSLLVAMSRSLTGKGTVTATTATRATVNANLTGKGSVTRTVAVAMNRSLVGKGRITGTIEVPIDEVPEQLPTYSRARVVNK